MNPDHRLILVCRTEKAAQEAAARLCAQSRINGYASPTIIPMSCDHARLESVKSFAERLPRILEDTYNPLKLEQRGVDVLCLNAAILRAKDSPVVFTEDGLEVTFQTNALSPFLIAHMTMGLMNPGGRVIISTSGLYTHTSLCLEGMMDGPRRKARKGFEMIDGSEFHFKRSYALSKVCNVALTIALQQRLASMNVIVNCFSPGLMMTSGLFRHQTEEDLANALSHSKFVRQNEKSVEWGGGALAFMALSEEAGAANGMYWSDTDSRKGDKAEYGIDFSPCPISRDAISQQCTEDLWHLFCQLAEVPTDAMLN